MKLVGVHKGTSYVHRIGVACSSCSTPMYVLALSPGSAHLSRLIPIQAVLPHPQAVQPHSHAVQPHSQAVHS